jgi:hypothetical protein
MQQGVWVGVCLLAAAAVGGSAASAQQGGEDELSRTILALDAAFWTAYNTCDVAAMPPFFTEDVEFYHDKGGITLGRDALVTSFKTGVCDNPRSRIRREAVEGSAQLFPLRHDGTLYGVIFSGEHIFYVKDEGKSERLDGHGRFTHLWLFRDNVWRIARVLSYDHGPVPYVNKRTAVALEDSALDRLAGRYKGPASNPVTVRREGPALVLSWSGGGVTVYPESSRVFFAKDRNLTFEFIGEGEAVTAMRVRENGDVVEDAARLP